MTDPGPGGQLLDGPYPVPMVASHRRRAVAVVALAAGVVALVLAGAVLVGFWVWTMTGPTREDAQRACRTAVEREFVKRSDTAAGGDRSVLVSMIGIDMLETVKTAGGYDINYTVRYQMTAALLPPVPSSLSLTCHARLKSRAFVTEVVNRS